MTRLQFIIGLIRLAAPHWQPVVATAQEVEQLERRYRIDAALIVAAAYYESRWTEQAVNLSSGTIGLLQIRPENFRDCRDGVWAPGCEAVRERLFNWRENLRIGVSYYAAARAYCLRRGRGGQPEAWLQGPFGFDAVQRSRCGWRGGRRLPIPPGVVQVVRHAASMRHERVNQTRRVLAPARARSRGAARTRAKATAPET